jgi:hypothetical protein
LKIPFSTFLTKIKSATGSFQSCRNLPNVFLFCKSFYKEQANTAFYVIAIPLMNKLPISGS